MAHNLQLTNLYVQTATDAGLALLNAGFIKIFTTPQPANANTAITTQTLLATLTFSATAFGVNSAGISTANAIGSDTDAAATGTAVWARCFKSDGTTAVFDMSVGVTGADLNLASVSIVQHATVSLTSGIFTSPKS